MKKLNRDNHEGNERKNMKEKIHTNERKKNMTDRKSSNIFEYFKDSNIVTS